MALTDALCINCLSEADAFVPEVLEHTLGLDRGEVRQYQRWLLWKEKKSSEACARNTALYESMVS